MKILIFWNLNFWKSLFFEISFLKISIFKNINFLNSFFGILNFLKARFLRISIFENLHFWKSPFLKISIFENLNFLKFHFWCQLILLKNVVVDVKITLTFLNECDLRSHNSPHLDIETIFRQKAWNIAKKKVSKTNFVMSHLKYTRPKENVILRFKHHHSVSKDQFCSKNSSWWKCLRNE